MKKQEKILDWASKEEVFPVKKFENYGSGSCQTLILYQKDEMEENIRHNYYSSPDISRLLVKNPLWKWLLTGRRYKTDYVRKSFVYPREMLLSEAVGKNVFSSLEPEKLNDILTVHETMLHAFQEELNRILNHWSGNYAKVNLPRLMRYYLRQSREEFSIKSDVFIYLELLSKRACLLGDEIKVKFQKRENPLQYLIRRIPENLPVKTLVLEYLDELAAILYCFYINDVKIMSEMFKYSPKIVEEFDGGLDDCRQFLYFPRVLKEAADFLDLE